MRTLRSFLLTFVGAAAVVAPMLATADSSSGAGSASANLDFQVVIDDYVYFQIGDPIPGNVDLVTFTVDGATEFPGSGSPIAGDQSMSVVLAANSNNLTIAAAGTGALTGSATTIAWSEIAIDNTAGTGDLPPPVIDGAASTGIDPSAVGTFSDTWSFSYLNTGFHTPGAYGGVTTGRVAFTATAL